MDLDGLVINEFVDVLRIRRTIGDYITMKNRCSSVIIAAISGKNIYSQGSTSCISDSAHPIFIPQGASYTINCEESGESLLFNFHALGLPEMMCALSRLPVYEFELCYAQLNILWQTQTKGFHLAELSELYSLLYRCLPDSVNIHDKGTILAPALDIMRKKYTDLSLTCDELAACVHVSTVYFRRLFLRSMGITPGKYLKKLRMEKAHSLLTEHIPVNRVAIEVGYSDIYQFSRAYKAYFGHAPTG